MVISLIWGWNTVIKILFLPKKKGMMIKTIIGSCKYDLFYYRRLEDWQSDPWQSGMNLQNLAEHQEAWNWEIPTVFALVNWTPSPTGSLFSGTDHSSTWLAVMECSLVEPSHGTPSSLLQAHKASVWWHNTDTFQLDQIFFTQWRLQLWFLNSVYLELSS